MHRVILFAQVVQRENGKWAVEDRGIVYTKDGEENQYRRVLGSYKTRAEAEEKMPRIVAQELENAS